jgi:hypothetical protein
MHREEPSMEPKHEDTMFQAALDSATGVPDAAWSQPAAPGDGAADGQPQTEGALALKPEETAPVVTREQRRSRRKRAIRARTISVKRMTKRELELGRMLYPESEENERPRTRAECADAPRPCPFVSCKHHLYLDVSARTGAIKLNFPDLEVWDMSETCALDVADRGGTTLEEVGAIMNLTRERIRQVEVKGLAKLAALRDMTVLRDYVDVGPLGKRRLPVLDDEREGREDAEDAEDGEDADTDADLDAETEADAEAGTDVEAEGEEAGDLDVEAFASAELEID